MTAQGHGLKCLSRLDLFPQVKAILIRDSYYLTTLRNAFTYFSKLYLDHINLGRTMQDLQPLLEAFIDHIRIRIRRDDSAEWTTLPSLWEQLNSSAGWSGGNSGGGAFGSRPVISTNTVSLVMEITAAITEAASDYGRIIKTNGQRDYPAELRAIAVSIPSDETNAWWAEKIKHWTEQTRAALGLNPRLPTSARGIACPACKAIYVEHGSNDQVVRSPALTITWAIPDGEGNDYHEDHEYKIRAVECRACLAVWWKGPALDEFATEMSVRNGTV